MHFVHVAHWFSRCTAAWRSRVRIQGRRFGDVTRRGREFGGVPRGSEVASRQQSGRSGSNCARSVPKWCRFGTLLYRIRFGTVRYTSNPTLVREAFRIGRRLRLRQTRSSSCNNNNNNELRAYTKYWSTPTDRSFGAASCASADKVTEKSARRRIAHHACPSSRIVCM